ncbi:MAG: hypothetical protein ACJAQT_003530 [Akkermansiaceae bacterium]|jgi:hypothetical protein
MSKEANEKEVPKQKTPIEKLRPVRSQLWAPAMSWADEIDDRSQDSFFSKVDGAM